jgi:hypothetical protein
MPCLNVNYQAEAQINVLIHGLDPLVGPIFTVLLRSLPFQRSLHDAHPHLGEYRVLVRDGSLRTVYFVMI